MYSFRIAFELGDTNRIDCKMPRLELAVLGTGCSRAVWMTSDGSLNIADSQHLRVVGSGHVSEEEAWRTGVRWRAALQRALAASYIGADFWSALTQC